MHLADLENRSFGTGVIAQAIRSHQDIEEGLYPYVSIPPELIKYIKCRIDDKEKIVCLSIILNDESYYEITGDRFIGCAIATYTEYHKNKANIKSILPVPFKP